MSFSTLWTSKPNLWSDPIDIKYNHREEMITTAAIAVHILWYDTREKPSCKYIR